MQKTEMPKTDPQAELEAESLQEPAAEAASQAPEAGGRRPKGRRIAEKEKKSRKPKGPSLRQRLGFGNRRWAKLGKKELAILLLPALAAVIAAAAMLFVTRDVNQYTLGSGACQYYGGSVYRLEKGQVMRRTAEEETVLGEENPPHKMTSLPIYYKEKSAMVLTQNMAYYTPRNGQLCRLDYFTEIGFKGVNGEARREGRDKQLAPGFLFDGKDMYIFLEPMVVAFNGYRLELPPMSYVEAVYKGDVMVFNFGSGEFVIEAPWDSVTASSIGGDYTISLLGDSMVTYDGTRTLLFGRPELLESLP